jgi:hypothetical protein
MAARFARVGLDTKGFLAQVREAASRSLEDEGLAPAWLQRWQLLQATFGPKGIHYETWLQPQRRQLEVGLHLEADAELNGWLLRRLGEDWPGVAHALGDGFELEQWTANWGRVHTILPFERIDAALVDEASDCLVRCIRALQPEVEALLADRRRR